MTPKSRTILIMLAILFVGILIGVFGVAFWHKQIRNPSPGEWKKYGKSAVVKKILTIVEADSAQAKQIRPMLMETFSVVDNLQQETDMKVKVLFDSFEVKVKPILSDQQLEKLRELRRHGKENQEK
jgi:flagellar basal body-associated protein FliL